MTSACGGLIRIGGKVSRITATDFTIDGLSDISRLGDCVMVGGSGGAPSLAEIIRIDRRHVIAKPYEVNPNVALGEIAWHRGPLTIAPHPAWQGRVVNALGEPIDGSGPLPHGPPIDPYHRLPPHPMQRAPAGTAIATGVRAIDIFTPLCAGQRIGIFAGAGVGKSSLLSMLATAHAFDTIVVALVGERGREVHGFLDVLIPASKGKAVAVVATADESPMMRALAPKTAMTIAEACRDAGQSVLLIVDSITRYAHAARDVALSAGEIPVARGYPPSVFSDLPRLLERAGPGTADEGTITGTITGIFSVLVDGDDPNEPVADCIRGTLDGHVVLSRAIAEEGRLPAIDLLASVSRLAQSAWKPEQAAAVQELRGLVARFEDTRDLRLMSAHWPGSDPQLDRAIQVVPVLYRHLTQPEPDIQTDDCFAGLAAVLHDALGNDPAPRPLTR